MRRPARSPCRTWLFSDTAPGARANLYSLVETAKANGLYLTHLYSHLPAATLAADFEALLPWNVKAALTAQ